MYNIPDGTLQDYEVEDGVRLPIIRETPPPCHECPKGGPEYDDEFRLSERNYQACLLYEKLQATWGAYVLPDHLRNCSLFAENMLLIKRAMESGRAEAQMNAYQKAREDAGREGI